MAKHGDSHQDGQGPSRVRKASDMHKRRIDKNERRDLRNRERETARDQVRQEQQDVRERQERFQIIHGGRELTPEEAAAFAQRVDAKHAAPAAADDQIAAAPDERAEIRAANRARPAAAPQDSAEAQGRAQAVDGDAAKVRRRRLTLPEVQSAAPDEAAKEAAKETAGEAAGEAAAEAAGEAAEGILDSEGSPGEGAPAPASEAGRFGKAADGKPPRKKHLVRRIVLITVGVLLAVVLILLGLFCWNRWLRYDDAAEIQGEWFAAQDGRRAPIVIGDGTIEFNPETTWHYTLDTTAKTITFTFGSQQGGGRYWFADGHEHLILEDGVGYTALGTFMADLQRTLTGKADEIPQGSTVTVLSRSADAFSNPALGASDGSPAVEGGDAGSGDAEPSSGVEEAQPPEGESPADGSRDEGDQGENAGEANGNGTDRPEESSDGDSARTEETHA